MTFSPTRIVEDALRALSHAWREGEQQFISVPVMYPSGALCTVQVSSGKHSAQVSDMSAGFIEAETLCQDSSFTSIVKGEAKRLGLKTDGRTIYTDEVTGGQLAAAIILVANASASVARAAVAHDADRREDFRSDVILDKLHIAFPAANVTRQLEVFGARAQWSVHNVVHLPDDRMAIFEPASMHQNSVSAKFLMFTDLVQRRDLSLNVVFRNPAKLDPKAQMLREVANVIGVDDAAEVYRSKALQ